MGVDQKTVYASCVVVRKYPPSCLQYGSVLLQYYWPKVTRKNPTLDACILHTLYCRSLHYCSCLLPHDVQLSRTSRMAYTIKDGDEKSYTQREHLLTNVEREEQQSCPNEHHTSNRTTKSRISIILLRVVLFIAYSIALSYIVATVAILKWREPETIIRPSISRLFLVIRILLTLISISTICYKARDHTTGAWQYSKSIRWWSTPWTW